MLSRDAGDILDRLSIARLKKERIGTKENERELDFFNKGYQCLKKKYSKIDWYQYYEFIYSINDFIWQLESGLKSGKERLKNPHYIFDVQNKEVLAQIGKSTILIRNFNHLRVSFKNIINKMVNEGFQDAKKNHLSE